MDRDGIVVFTVDQIAACSTALRTALGLPPEHFTTERFVGMISDEIEQLRAKGWSDGEIAALVHESTQSVITAEDIADYYAPPELRRRD
jgi:hypothetical protein